MDEKGRLRNSGRIHGVRVYENSLKAGRAELKKLLERRQAIDRRTKELHRFTGAVLSVCEEDGIELPSDLLLPFDEDETLSISLIDAVRAVLKQSGNFMTVAEVREKLLAMELDLHKLWNPTALVRANLKCLLSRGEVTGEPPNKPVRFRWFNSDVPDMEPDLLSSLSRPRAKDWLKEKLGARRRAGLLH